MRNTKRSSCAECMGHECTGMLSAWYLELKTCIVELNFPLSQWPIQTPNNVHYVLSACLCPVLGFLTFVSYTKKQYPICKVARASWIFLCELLTISFHIMLLKNDFRGQRRMIRCSRRTSADGNTVLGRVIANVSLLWRLGVRGM